MRKVTGELDAVHARHADVDQNDVDGLLGGHRQRGLAVGGFAAGGVGQLGRHIGQQVAQAAACRRLVVDDQDTQRW